MNKYKYEAYVNLLKDSQKSEYKEKLRSDYFDENYIRFILFADTNFSYKMNELYKIISNSFQREVMEQAFYLEYITKKEIVTQNEILDEEKPYLNFNKFNNKQREEIETICLEYDTAIALTENLYGKFNQTQYLICKYLAQNDNLQLYNEEVETYLERYDSNVAKFKSNDNYNETIRQEVLEDIQEIIYQKEPDLHNIRDLLAIQWKLIAISKCLYIEDDIPTKSLLGSYKNWKKQHEICLKKIHNLNENFSPCHMIDDNYEIDYIKITQDYRDLSYWLFFVPSELLSGYLYRYITSFHNKLK